MWPQTLALGPVFVTRFMEISPLNKDISCHTNFADDGPENMLSIAPPPLGGAIKTVTKISLQAVYLRVVVRYFSGDCVFRDVMTERSLPLH